VINFDFFVVFFWSKYAEIKKQAEKTQLFSVKIDFLFTIWFDTQKAEEMD